MAHSTYWWILAGLAVGTEMLTGTVYLLLIATGLAAAAASAHMGAPLTAQVVVAAIVGAGSVLAWRLVRRNRPASLPSWSNPDVNMDVGETVQVSHWETDGTAFVQYRGARWTVVPRAGGVHASGPHRVVEVVGNRLVVDRL